VQQTTNIIRLTALWAFVEAGLGGFLHALHLPFTGIVLGGFSVLIIRLISLQSPKPFYHIMQATLVVLAIKAMMNPATSPFAYLAVGFQGLLGAFLYQINQQSLAIHLLFAIISMLESAVQKLLVVTLFMGKTFWVGLDALGITIQKDLGLQSTVTVSIWLIGFYILLFTIWGFVLGLWMHVLPKQIADRMHLYQHLQKQNLEPTIIQKQNKWMQIFYAFCIAAVVFTYLPIVQQHLHASVVYIIKVMGFYAIWQFFLRKFISKLILRWSKKFSARNQMYAQVQEHLPSVGAMVQPIYKQVQCKHKGLAKWKEFLLGLMVVSVRLEMGV
jgi:hypothetical protein